MESTIKINSEKEYHINNNNITDYSLNDSFNNILEKWYINLKKTKSFYMFIQNNSDLIEKKKYKDAPYHVLDNDIKRTKIYETIDYPNFQEELKKILLFYCEYNSIQYKQGMNEIMTVFLSLKFKEPSIEIYQIYNCFNLFMDYFLINFYKGKDISSLNSCYSIFDLLLKYHEPEIYKKMIISFITPVIYATNWLLTYLTNKNTIVVSYVIFNFLINEMDKSMVFFLCIALLKYNKNDIINSPNYKLIEYISKLNIENIEIANNVINLALKIRQNTPYSLYILVNRLQIFFPHSKYIQSQFDLIKPNYFTIFPLFPSEVLFKLFPTILSCPDYTCNNFNCKISNKIPKRGLCEYCKFQQNNMKERYYIIDIRIYNKDENNYNGTLPNMMLLNKNILSQLINEKDKIEDYFYKEVKKIKEQHNNKQIHFSILTNITENYEDFERDLYTNNQTTQELKNIKYGLEWNKEKVLNEKEVKKYINRNIKEKIVIEEYIIFRKIVTKLINEKIKYISFIYGGFKELHKLSKNLEILLPLHNIKNCIYCNENIEEKKEKNNYISEKCFNELCKNSDNKVFPCMYGKNMNGTIIFCKNILYIICAKISSNKDILFQIVHKLKKTNILSFSAAKDKKIMNTSLTFLYTKNNSLTNLILVTVNLLNESQLSEFLKMCHKFDICN